MGCQDCSHFLRRDVLYLDLALDTAVRAAIEPVLSELRRPNSEHQLSSHAGLVLNLVAACAEKGCLSMGSNIELVMVHKELQVWQATHV